MSTSARSGQFQATISDEDAAVAVSKVSLFASPDAPKKVSQRNFDNARGPAGYPDLPSARALCKRMQLTWPDLLRAAHAPSAQRTRQLSYGRRNTGRSAITLDDCSAAIGRVARRAGKNTLTRSEYEKQRKAILAGASRAHKQNRPLVDSLPTINQIDAVLAAHESSWAEASGKVDIDHPSQTSRQDKLQAACGQFAHETGKLPASPGHLNRWAIRRRIKLAQCKRPQLDKAIRAIEAQREADGMPALKIAESSRSLPWEALDALPQGSRRARQEWTEESILNGLNLAAGMLPAGQSLTQRRLKALAAKHMGIPSWDIVHRCCKQNSIGFADLKTKAALHV